MIPDVCLLSDPGSAYSEQMLSFLEKYSKLSSPLRKSGNRIFTTETRRHGEQQDLLKRRGMKEAMRLPSFAKAAKGWATLPGTRDREHISAARSYPQ
jgi:hypothetical protein